MMQHFVWQQDEGAEGRGREDGQRPLSRWGQAGLLTSLPRTSMEPRILKQGLFSVFQLFENRKNTKSRHRKVTIYSFTGNQRNRCSTFRVKRNQTIYWQEGLLVTFDGGYLR